MPTHYQRAMAAKAVARGEHLSASGDRCRMRCEYKLRAEASCPVDADVTDVYELVIVTHGMIPVEELLEIVHEETLRPVYQEVLTERLHERLGAMVTTTGNHSGVETTCCCS